MIKTLLALALILAGSASARELPREDNTEVTV